MEKIGVIPFRWQSSRFPGKALVNILGKSLIQRTYENSTQSKLLDRVVIATDDQRIFNHAQDFGAEVFMTSSSCPTGTDRTCEVIDRHFPQAEIVVNIQGDEPCLNPDVLDALIVKLQETPEALVTTPVAKITDPRDIFSPSAVKCVFDQNGRALYFSRAPIPFPQTANKIHDYYRHLGVYCFRKPFLLELATIKPTRLQEIEDLEQLKILERGLPIHVCLVEDQAIGVDTPEDLKRIEEILCQKESTSLSQEV